MEVGGGGYYPFKGMLLRKRCRETVRDVRGTWKKLQPWLATTDGLSIQEEARMAKERSGHQICSESFHPVFQYSTSLILLVP